MNTEQIAAALQERAAALGYLPKETIYRLTWEDVIDVLAETMAGKDIDPAGLPNAEIEALLQGGYEAAQALPWSDTIQVGVNDAWWLLRQEAALAQEGISVP